MLRIGYSSSSIFRLCLIPNHSILTQVVSLTPPILIFWHIPWTGSLGLPMWIPTPSFHQHNRILGECFHQNPFQPNPWGCWRVFHWTPVFGCMQCMRYHFRMVFHLRWNTKNSHSIHSIASTDEPKLGLFSDIHVCQDSLQVYLPFLAKNAFSYNWLWIGKVYRKHG